MASSFSPSVPSLMKDKEPRNWADLPPELTSSILLRLGAVEILKTAQKVCRSWRRVCKDPLMWRKIDMRSLRGFWFHNCQSLYRQVVDLSQGGLLEISIGDFCSDDLLTYIADRSSNLRSLGVDLCLGITNDGLVNAIAKLPLLETLEISRSESKLNLKAIGQACPQLHTLKLNCSGNRPSRIKCDDDEYALAIAESMPQLRHLQLLGNRLTETGLNAILDILPHLKHLDLRMCLNINLVGNLERRCLEKIKELRLPNDSTADCPFAIIFVDSDFDNFLEYIYDNNIWL